MSADDPMSADGEAEPPERRRIDTWLWFARFFKTRSLATRACAAGRVRCSGKRVAKAHHQVRADDVLTFPQGRHIRVVRILALGARRGPAADARQLYEDLAPPTPDNAFGAQPDPA